MENAPLNRQRNHRCPRQVLDDRGTSHDGHDQVGLASNATAEDEQRAQDLLEWQIFHAAESMEMLMGSASSNVKRSSNRSSLPGTAGA